MKINTENMEMYAGDRNVELAEEAGGPLAEISEEQWLQLVGLTPTERKAAWALIQNPPEPEPPAPEETLTVTREELEHMIQEGHA